VLGPAVAKAHLGGPAAWGAITAADSVGLIAGGVLALRVTPRRPILVVVMTGAFIAVLPVSLAVPWPLPLICLTAVILGIAVEFMMVQWTVAMARNIPPGKLARVASYDVLGSVMAMPVGALVAGPIAAAFGVTPAEYGAAVLIVVASLLALVPRDVRTMRSATDPEEREPGAGAGSGEEAPLPVRNP
jgi:predicted MFS family arabinose efflux permease